MDVVGNVQVATRRAAPAPRNHASVRVSLLLALLLLTACGTPNAATPTQEAQSTAESILEQIETGPRLNLRYTPTPAPLPSRAAATYTALALPTPEPASSVGSFARVAEANRAFAEADYPTALALYDEAIPSDEGREPPEPDGDEAALRRFAAFRALLTVLHLEGDGEAAARRLAWLTERYPDHPITEAARMLLDDYRQSGDLSAACAHVTTFAATMPDIISPLETTDDAPALSGADLCPIGAAQEE